MAQKSGFFNALLNAGVYDRTYSADDYCDNLATIISNGVLRSQNDDLKVTASGLNLSVNIGRAWINGHYYNNTTAYALPAVSPPTGGSRIDNVVLRFDNTVTGRSITIQYVQGTAATSPVAPTLTRTASVYELCIAQITVNANASNVAVTDTRSNTDLCGWVYSVSGDGSFFTSLDNSFTSWFENVKNTLASVTLFKQYKWDTTLASATNTVNFNIPQYDPDTCFFDVFVNGLYSDDYTASGTVLTFSTTLTAGTEVTVLAYKSIDGTGIMSVADEITQLQNQYATLAGMSKYIYNATGVDDNISLSQIAQAIYTGEWNSGSCTSAANAFLTALGGTTWLQNLEADSQITIEVVGKLGVTTPSYGSGTSSSRYRFFNFGQISHSDMRVMFDFSKAETINVSCSNNTSNIIFYGTDLWIKGANVNASNMGVGATGCDIQMIAGSNVGSINIEDCVFNVTSTANGRISDAGTYINCDCTVISYSGSAFCFSPVSAKLLRVIGGRYLAYVTNTSNYTAAIFYTSSTNTNAVAIAQSINCPTISYSDGSTTFYQQYLAVGFAGKTIIDNVISTMNSTGTYNTITNQIWQSKNY
jgi:hypothetical protein